MRALILALVLLASGCVHVPVIDWCAKGDGPCFDITGRRVQTWQEKIQAEIDASLR